MRKTKKHQHHTPAEINIADCVTVSIGQDKIPSYQRFALCFIFWQSIPLTGTVSGQYQHKAGYGNQG